MSHYCFVGQNSNIWTLLIVWCHLICVLQSLLDTAIMRTYGKPWFCEWAQLRVMIRIWVLSSVAVAHDPHSKNGCPGSRYWVYRPTRTLIIPGGISAHLNREQIQTQVITPAIPVSSCVIWGQLPSFSEPQFLHLQRETITGKKNISHGCPMPDMQKKLSKY